MKDNHVETRESDQELSALNSVNFKYWQYFEEKKDRVPMRCYYGDDGQLTATVYEHRVGFASHIQFSLSEGQYLLEQAEDFQTFMRYLRNPPIRKRYTMVFEPQHDLHLVVYCGPPYPTFERNNMGDAYALFQDLVKIANKLTEAELKDYHYYLFNVAAHEVRSEPTFQEVLPEAIEALIDLSINQGYVYLKDYNTLRWIFQLNPKEYTGTISWNNNA